MWTFLRETLLILKAERVSITMLKKKKKETCKTIVAIEKDARSMEACNIVGQSLHINTDSLFASSTIKRNAYAHNLK